uniref:NADH dehydrogenase [ubiquinone] 1 alpha subcomplex subunit 3 n=1 Tax=Theropithecus gelada TaxID=9565 RepID=A0A8D2FRZ1_THEGE
MAARLRGFLKNAWAEEPALVVSFVVGSLAVILPPFSPYTKYSITTNKATPHNYPVPLGRQSSQDVLTHWTWL